jgi:hypothetical protein
MLVMTGHAILTPMLMTTRDFLAMSAASAADVAKWAAGIVLDRAVRFHPGAKPFDYSI